MSTYGAIKWSGGVYIIKYPTTAGDRELSSADRLIIEQEEHIKKIEAENQTLKDKIQEMERLQIQLDAINESEEAVKLKEKISEAVKLLKKSNSFIFHTCGSDSLECEIYEFLKTIEAPTK